VWYSIKLNAIDEGLIWKHNKESKEWTSVDSQKAALNDFGHYQW
jgi:hypothetical protein